MHEHTHAHTHFEVILFYEPPSQYREFTIVSTNHIKGLQENIASLLNIVRLFPIVPKYVQYKMHRIQYLHRSG